MIMSLIWTVFLVISLLFASMQGNISAVSSSVLTGAQAGIELAISIAGSICLWCGVGKVMEKAGITSALSKLLRPVLHLIFPGSRKDRVLAGHLSANICANFLGLGNAATPMGIAAVKRMKDPAHPDLATHEMCRLIVLNTASIQLIPNNVAAIRASLGAVAPFDILPAVWISSVCSAGLGLLSAWIMGRLWKHG